MTTRLLTAGSSSFPPSSPWLSACCGRSARSASPSCGPARRWAVSPPAVAVYDYFDVRDKLDEAKQGANGLAGFSAGSGWGLTLCIIAGLLMLITSVISALRD